MSAVKFKLDAIEMDTAIQCRAEINQSVVDEYAERMAEGDEFPPIDLYGTQKRSWLGDGWHRVMAAKQAGESAIRAVLHPGARIEALKHALGANAVHGQRRTNEDKRRCVQIAIMEFSGLSSRTIAEMCGVGDQLVRVIREEFELRESRTSTRTGSDGKQYPAHNKPAQSTGTPPREREPIGGTLEITGERDAIEQTARRIHELDFYIALLAVKAPHIERTRLKGMLTKLIGAQLELQALFAMLIVRRQAHA